MRYIRIDKRKRRIHTSILIEMTKLQVTPTYGFVAGNEIQACVPKKNILIRIFIKLIRVFNYNYKRPTVFKIVSIEDETTITIEPV